MPFKKMKYICIIFLSLFLTSCGFKPMYKLSESNFDFKSYSVSLINANNTSREVKDEISKSFPSDLDSEQSYLIEIKATENLEPLITNTDGTIAKYRIEIIMMFKVKGKNDDVYLIEDFVRGFAQYAVETSEIKSEDKKKRMIRMATSSAIQMMISKIQSDIPVSNGN